jgi:hypothetical protein
VLKMQGIVIRDLFHLWTHHTRSVAILRMGQYSEMAVIFESMIIAMRAQGVTQILELGIGMTQDWMARKCSPVNPNSKWRKLKCSQSLSKPMLAPTWDFLSFHSVQSINQSANQIISENDSKGWSRIRGICLSDSSWEFNKIS